jgi:hypothetical protein
MALDLASLSIAVDATQVAPAVAELDKLTEAGKRTETATTATSQAMSGYQKSVATMTAAMGTQTQATVGMNAEQLKLVAQLDTLTSSYDKAYKAQNTYANGIDLLNKAHKAGIVDNIAYAEAVSKLDARMMAASNTVNEFGITANAAARKVAVLTHELASGRVRQFEGTLLSLVQTLLIAQPVLVLVGLAITAVIAIFAYGLVHTEAMNRSLNSLIVQFDATGRGADISKANLRGFVDELARLPGISTNAAIEVVRAFAETSRVTKDLMASALKLVPDLASALGVDAPKAAKELATALQNPIEGLFKLDKQLNILTGSQYAAALEMKRTGDILGAQTLLVDALGTRIKGMAENEMTSWQKSMQEIKVKWNEVKGTMSDTSFLDEMGKNFSTRMKLTIDDARGLFDYLKTIKNFWLGTDTSTTTGSSTQGINAQTDAFNKAAAASTAYSASVAQAVIDNMALYNGYAKGQTELEKLNAIRTKVITTMQLEESQGIQTSKTLKEQSNIVAGLDADIAKLNKTRSPANDGSASALESAKLYLQNVQNQTDGIARLSEGEKMLTKIRDGLYDGKYPKAIADLIKSYYEQAVAGEKVNEMTKTQAEAQKRLTDLLNYLQAAQDQVNKARDRYREQGDDILRKLQDEQDGIGKTALELRKLTVARQLDIDLRRAIAASPNMSQAELDTLKATNAEMLIKASRIIDISENLKAEKGLWDEVGKLAGSFLSDVLVKGKSAVDLLKQEFAKFFEYLIQMFARRFILNIAMGGSLSGSFTDAIASAGTSALGGGGSGISSLIGAGYNSLFGGTSGSAGAGAGANVWAGAGYGDGAATAGTSSAAGGLGTVSSVGAAIGTAALGAIAGYYIGGAISRNNNNSAATGGAVGGGVGAAIGAYAAAGSVLGPWGAVIGAVLGAVVGAFAMDRGGKKEEGGATATYDNKGNVIRTAGYADGQSTFGVTGQDGPNKYVASLIQATGAGFYDILGKLGGTSGGLKFGLDYDTDPKGSAGSRIWSSLKGADGQSLYSNFQDVGRDPKNLDKGIGLELQRMLIAGLQQSNLPKEIADLFKGINATTATQDQINAVLKAALEMKAVLDALANTTIKGLTIGALQALQASGETLSATLTRVTGVFSATSLISDASFKATGIATFAMREEIVRLGGGMQAFTSASQSYYTNFYSQAEQSARLTNQLSDALATVGLKLPTTRDGFRALVDAQDLTTASGRSTYALLINLAAAFAQLVPAANAATAAVVATVTAINVTTVGALQDAASKAVNTRYGQLTTGLTTADYGTTQSSLISAVKTEITNLQDYIYKANIQNMSDPAFQQMQKWKDLLSGLTGNFAEYLKLEAANPGKGKQILDLNTWYTQQQSLLQGNNSALLDLQKVYEDKRAAILINSSTATLSALQTAQNNVTAYLQGSQVSALSPLTPTQQLAAAQANYQRNFALAQGGDVGAINQAGQLRDVYLQIARGIYASSPDYNKVYNNTFDQLATLTGGQINAPTAAAEKANAQAIVDSITALSAKSADTTKAILALLTLISQGISVNDPAAIALLAKITQANSQSSGGSLTSGKVI